MCVCVSASMHACVCKRMVAAARIALSDINQQFQVQEKEASERFDMCSNYICVRVCKHACVCNCKRMVATARIALSDMNRQFQVQEKRQKGSTLFISLFAPKRDWYIKDTGNFKILDK